MTAQEIKVEAFLEELGVDKTRLLFPTLKEMFKRLNENIENTQGIISTGQNGKKNEKIRWRNTSRILHFVKNNNNTKIYKEIFGDNQIVSSKEFVLECYYYYKQNY